MLKLHLDKTMKQSIGAIIYQAVNERKWLDITYGNKEDAPTHFWFAITDIDFENDKLQGEIFNFFKSTECMDSPKPINRKKFSPPK